MPRNTSQQASDPRPKEVELEECTQLFFKYSVIIQEQVDAMRHLPKEVAAAHAQVTEEHHERQKHALQRELTLEELQNTLSYYGGLCEKEPQTLLDRVRIVFYASYYVQIMVHEILGHRDRPPSDIQTVLARGGQLLREYHSGKLSKIPTRAPAIVNFTPPVPTTCHILDKDIAIWASWPNQLVGKCFISTEMVRRVFLINDYSVKQRKGPQYDVIYEDLGLDEILTLDPETLLGMLSKGQAELVTNALPRS